MTYDPKTKVKIFENAPNHMKFTHVVEKSLMHLFQKFQTILTVFE